MKLSVFLIAILALSQNTNAKVFTDCTLATALQLAQVPVNLINDFICLVQAVSGFDTAALNVRLNQTYYGLFQIGTQWCTVGSIGGSCQADCNSFLTDNIAGALKCALLIYQQQGFEAWCAWRTQCSCSVTDYVSQCGLSASIGGLNVSLGGQVSVPAVGVSVAVGV